MTEHNQTIFKAWPKIRRDSPLNVVVTEKMDGTNACIIVANGAVVGVQSRRRLITPLDDNMGFACWVWERSEKLKELGDGYHYGEWCGPGIQKNPHNLDEKALFLFQPRPDMPLISNLHRVPFMYCGAYYDDLIVEKMRWLGRRGEQQGYTPEGIMLHFKHFDYHQKVTFQHSQGKWRLD